MIEFNAKVSKSDFLVDARKMGGVRSLACGSLPFAAFALKLLFASLSPLWLKIGVHLSLVASCEDRSVIKKQDLSLVNIPLTHFTNQHNHSSACAQNEQKEGWRLGQAFCLPPYCPDPIAPTGPSSPPPRVKAGAPIGISVLGKFHAAFFDRFKPA